MKIKIVGFKCGKSRPTANRTVFASEVPAPERDQEVGALISKILAKSDFWIKKHKFPKGFQVLSMNCQFIKVHENHENRRVDD